MENAIVSPTLIYEVMTRAVTLVKEVMENVLRCRCFTVVVQVFAGGHRGAASVGLQAAVDGGQQLLQTLDSVSHIPQQALALALVLQGPNY